MGGKQKPAPSADCVSGNRAAKLPASWQPTEKHTQLAEELNLDLAAAVEVFKTWADGKRQKNWNLTFTNGLKSWIQSQLAQQLEARQRMNRVLATRPIPPDWWPNPQGVNLAGMSQENLGRAVGVFRDYHAAKGNVRADWDAQWRKDLNWVRDAAGHAQSGRGGIDWDEAERELQAVLTPQQAAGGTETGFRDAFTPTPVEVYAEPEKPPENGLNGNDYSTDGVLFTDPPS